MAVTAPIVTKRTITLQMFSRNPTTDLAAEAGHRR